MSEFGPSTSASIHKYVKQTQQDRKRQLEADQKFVFSNPAGRRFVAALIWECGLYQSNPDMGKRSVALGLRAAALACGEEHWHAIEKEIVDKRIDPKNAPRQEPEDE